MEVIHFPSPRGTVKFSRPVVHRATALGIRWNASPAPKSTAIVPNRRNCRFPLLPRIIKIPIVMTVVRYTTSNEVSTIACITRFLSWPNNRNVIACCHPRQGGNQLEHMSQNLHHIHAWTLLFHLSKFPPCRGGFIQHPTGDFLSGRGIVVLPK